MQVYNRKNGGYSTGVAAGEKIKNENNDLRYTVGKVLEDGWELKDTTAQSK